ncbi:MAG: SH3 domain-containing protein [Chloroflexota bacterium]
MKYMIGFAALLMILLVVMVACSSAENSETSSSESPDTAAVAEEAGAAEAEKHLKVRALDNLNLRAGPGTDYAVVGSLPADGTLDIVGRNSDSSWLAVKDENGQQVWITGDASLVEIDEGVANLPVVEAITPPYDANHPVVLQILAEVPLVVHHGGTFTCASHGGTQNLLPEVANGNVLGPHAGDFVWVDKGNVLFKMNSGSLELVNENSIARFENGEETLSFATAMQMVADGDIVWNGTLGQSPGRGVTGCDPHL